MLSKYHFFLLKHILTAWHTSYTVNLLTILPLQRDMANICPLFTELYAQQLPKAY